VQRIVRPFLIAAIAPLLAGCVAGMAASAVGMAAASADRARTGNQALQPQAREACVARAAQYGAVHVIDVEQHRVDKIIVWGTVEDGKQRRSFQCDFGTQVTGFTLRTIKPQR
jgi:hypothetical protein